MKKSSSNHARTFETMQQLDVPQSRNGKHRKIVSAILDDLDGLAPGSALKVPFEALHDTKENVRAALSRESKKQKIDIATAADAKFLYVWKTEQKTSVQVTRK